MFGGMCEKYGEARVYWAFSVLLILLNILILFAVHSLRTSFNHEGNKFRLIDENGSMMVMQDGNNNKLEMIDKTLPSDISFGSNIARFDLSYKDKVISYDASNAFDKGIVITLSNGEQYKSDFVQVTYNDIDTRPSEVQLVYKVIKIKNENLSFFNYILPFLGAVILIFLGLGCIIYPEAMWRFQHMLDVRGGEPTDWAIFTRRFSGCIIIVMAELFAVFTF